MDAARGAFYRIYDNDERSNIIDNLLEQLDFHPLSVTLLATLAHQNSWDNRRLAKEWEQRQTSMLKTEHSNSLAATIELSLASPMFRGLGPHARELLGAIAFFPQGIDEDNFDWLFPAIADRGDIVDRFCMLSLTSRSNRFITMLAPIRDHFNPRDPRTSPLLCATKDHYTGRLRLLGDLEPDQPGFAESRWIRSEDINVEHLLNVFTSFGTDSHDSWGACADFIAHLNWHKPRSTVLKSKIEGLPDDHHSKPQCLLQLSELLQSLGNYVEQKRVLTHTLEIERGQVNNNRVARALRFLVSANRMLDLYEEGIQRSNEALEIYERLGDAEGQAKCWNYLGWLLHEDDQFDAAEGAASRALKIFLDRGREYWICDSHRLLGEIYESKGEIGKSIHHSEAALQIASSFEWHDQLFWTHYSLVWLFHRKNEFDNAQARVEQAKMYAVNDAYKLGRAMELLAWIWYRRGWLEEAKAEALCALEAFEKLGATKELGRCRDIFREIEQATTRSGDSDPSCKCSGHDMFPTLVNPPSARR